MREGWKSIALNEICIKITSGGTPLRKKIEYYGGNIPWVKTKQVNYNRIYDSEEYLTDIGLKNSSAKLIPANSVIVAMYGDGNTAGRCAINKVPVTTNQACCNLIIDKNKADYNFIFYYISTQYNKLVSLKSGAGQQNLNAQTFKEFIISLPPLETQRKIASILSRYDDLIENNMKRIKILEEMAQQTYEEWFVRMRFPGASASLSHQSKPETERSRSLPEGWEKVKLIKVCDLVMGQSPKSEHYNDEGKGLPFHQGVKDYGFRFPINNSWSTAGNKKAIPNSILFSVRAPTGRLNVASEEIILGRGLAAINHKEGLKSFLYYQLRNIFFEDNLIGGGAIYASVTKNDVERIEIISPGKIAEHFNNYASKIDLEILNLTSQNQRLQESREILLPRLMMGMIEV